MAEAQSLKIPYVSLSPTACPLWIAHEAGYFKKHNVNAELVYIPGGSLVVQSVLSGDVNVANMALPLQSALGHEELISHLSPVVWINLETVLTFTPDHKTC